MNILNFLGIREFDAKYINRLLDNVEDNFFDSAKESIKNISFDGESIDITTNNLIESIIEKLIHQEIKKLDVGEEVAYYLTNRLSDSTYINCSCSKIDIDLDNLYFKLSKENMDILKNLVEITS